MLGVIGVGQRFEEFFIPPGAADILWRAGALAGNAPGYSSGVSSQTICSTLTLCLHYLTAQWSKLVRYADDGRYPIDNNACENAIRPFVVGRQNSLFAVTVGGANGGANLSSLLQICAANGIGGYSQLRARLVALPTAETIEDFEALLPWRLAAADR